MVRLYDPDETRLSFAMKPTASAFAQFVSNSIKKCASLSLSLCIA